MNSKTLNLQTRNGVIDYYILTINKSVEIGYYYFPDKKLYNIQALKDYLKSEGTNELHRYNWSKRNLQKW